MNNKDEYAQTPVYYACRDNKAETVKFLLSKGANINEVDMHGQTCLFYAAKAGRLEVCRILLDKGADVHVADKKGIQAINQAQKYKKADVVDLLIERGATPPASKIAEAKRQVSKPKNERNELKMYVLTTLVDGVFVPLTQDEFDAKLELIKRENPEIAACFTDPEAVGNLRLPEIGESV